MAIAATGDDKANLVHSLLAKTEFGVPRTVGRVNHPSNEWMFDDLWGVDVAVSTPRLMCALVEEAVTVGDLVRLFSFRGGHANLVEMTLPGGLAPGRHAESPTSTCPATRCWSPSSATVPRGPPSATRALEAQRRAAVRCRPRPTRPNWRSTWCPGSQPRRVNWRSTASGARDQFVAAGCRCRRWPST